MRTIHRNIAFLATLAAALGGAAAIGGGAGAPQSAVVTDPVGDTKNNAEPWQDIIRGKVERQGDLFTFSQEMAAPLPAEAPDPPGENGWYFWEWGIDTDPDLAPAGWPFPKTHVATHDFMIGFASDGEEYFAFVADRRPLVLGEEPIITAAPFRIRGAVIEVFVDADLLDDPSEFSWRCGTVTLHPHVEADGFQVFDRFDAGYARWPQN